MYSQKTAMSPNIVKDMLH